MGVLVTRDCGFGPGARAGLVALALLALVGGCAKQQAPRPKGNGAAVTPTTPAPAPADVIAKYNARVERLDAVESPIELLVKMTDAEGKTTTEQGEGNLKMVRPRQVALRIDKVSQTFFWLGSNDEKYWWIDLRGEEKVALMGTHAKATPETAARFGLPVHPSDLLDLAGVAPLEAAGDATTVWASDGKQVVLELAGRWGRKRLTVDPASGEASRVDILDAAGGVVASSRLEKYARVNVRGAAAASPRMATRLFAEVPDAKATVELIVHTPENNGAGRIRPANFDFADLARRLGVQREVDLDAPPRATDAGDSNGADTVRTSGTNSIGGAGTAQGAGPSETAGAGGDR